MKLWLVSFLKEKTEQFTLKNLAVGFLASITDLDKI